MEKETWILTKFISAWGWQVISMIFLVGTIIIFGSEKILYRQVFITSFFILFAVAQFVSLKRKREVYEDE